MERQITWADQYEALRRDLGAGPWAERILAELGFAAEMSRAEGGRYDGIIAEAIAGLDAKARAEGAITRALALDTEQALAELAPAVKAYQVICVAHAHIDMNWMWGFQETASVTVDTFRTILRLMEEYPDFTFSQSQASVYAIIEQFAPALLEPIRARIREGRWEVTASTWVENDKNMASGEAMARHLLYTKRYLARLLGIDADSLTLDFEPDTFGHSAYLPEALVNGGIQYYYHCRGYDGENLYRWQAPSGASVLVYREPEWYNGTIEPYMLTNLPSLCHRYGIKIGLKVYGVGDHGGGPTRRDLDRLLDMQSWPLMPTLTFGSLSGFFQALEPYADQFPLVKGELNYVFTGCYTAQSRIKQANRIAEDRLYDAEALDAAAAAMLPDFAAMGPLEPAWRRLLFNQFHDILPGSGVPETREYALGEFQKLLAAGQINANHAMGSLCSAIDTAKLKAIDDSGLSLGAGVGFGLDEAAGFGLPQSERGEGLVRAYTFFNTTQYARCETAELTLWDWQGDPDRLCVEDMDGKPVAHQLLGEGTHYWGHHYLRLAVQAEVPALGYATYVVRQASTPYIMRVPDGNPRCDRMGDAPIMLDNGRIRATLDSRTMALRSLLDCASGAELLDPASPAGVFQLIWENPVYGMTSWRVGPYSQVINLNETAKVQVQPPEYGPLCQRVQYTLAFGQSTMKVTVCLNQGSDRLDYAVEVDWHEHGSKTNGIPQLGFSVPIAASSALFRYAVPFGYLDRPALEHDVPALGLACALTSEKPGLALLADCKYGFRGTSRGLYVDLMRGSYDPDPYPEDGVHHLRLGLAICSDASSEILGALADSFQHPLYFASTGLHMGTLPPAGSLCQIPQGLRLAALKPAEESGMILRLYNPMATEFRGRITFSKPIASAWTTDFTERHDRPLPVEKDGVMLCIPPFSVVTLRLLPA